MAKLELNNAQRRELRAQAHHLSPIVTVGTNGLSDAVQSEVDAALRAHALVKVRVHNDSKDERERMLETLADVLSAAPVQHIGKLLVLWRPKPDVAADDVSAAADPATQDKLSAAPRTVKFVKYSKRGGQRPQVRRLRVLGNERVTAGGKVKRARRTQKSIKKGRSR